MVAHSGALPCLQPLDVINTIKSVPYFWCNTYPYQKQSCIWFKAMTFLYWRRLGSLLIWCPGLCHRAGFRPISFCIFLGLMTEVVFSVHISSGLSPYLSLGVDRLAAVITPSQISFFQPLLSFFRMMGFSSQSADGFLYCLCHWCFPSHQAHLWRCGKPTLSLLWFKIDEIWKLMKFMNTDLHISCPGMKIIIMALQAMAVLLKLKAHEIRCLCSSVVPKQADDTYSYMFARKWSTCENGPDGRLCSLRWFILQGKWIATARVTV